MVGTAKAWLAMAARPSAHVDKISSRERAFSEMGIEPCRAEWRSCSIAACTRFAEGASVRLNRAVREDLQRMQRLCRMSWVRNGEGLDCLRNWVRLLARLESSCGERLRKKSFGEGC